MAETTPPNSILYTIRLPAFNSITHQLELSAHHLVSSQLSYSPSFPSCLLLLTRPPLHPYQQLPPAPTLDDDAPLSRRDRKRRRLAQPQQATPADWALQREKEENKTTTDRESEGHHKGILFELEGAMGAVREGWEKERREGEGEGWMGDVEGYVEWVEKEREGRKELDLVGLARELTTAEQVALNPIAEPLLLLSSASSQSHPLSTLLNRIIHNPSSSSPYLLRTTTPSTSTSATIHLPPCSAFLLSDFHSWSLPSSGIASFGQKHGGWDLLLLDPPWPNASATRAATYDTFDAYDLWKLDLPALLGKTKPCLVAVWLTNKVKYRRLLIDKLFPSWGIKGPLAEWYWVKISSSSGEPVWSLESEGRRCYEGLLLGYYNPSSTSAPLPSLPHSKIFLSTPLNHSRKPILTELLRPYLPRAPNVLELFARTALAGVECEGEGEGRRERGVSLAVGNEACRFNVVEEGGVRGWLKEKEREREGAVQEGEGGVSE